MKMVGPSLSKTPKPISGPSPLIVSLKGPTTYLAGGTPKTHSTQIIQASSAPQTPSHRPLLKSQQENYYPEHSTTLPPSKGRTPSPHSSLSYLRSRQQSLKAPASLCISHQQQQYYPLPDPLPQLWPHHLRRILTSQPTQGMDHSKDIPLLPLTETAPKAEAL